VESCAGGDSSVTWTRLLALRFISVDRRIPLIPETTPVRYAVIISGNSEAYESGKQATPHIQPGDNNG